MEESMEMLQWMGELFREEPHRITEFFAFALASFGIPFGIGGTALKGYWQGKALLPPFFVWAVNTPLGLAMGFRIATFILDGKYYYFLITIDAIGFFLSLVILGQLYGLFLRKKPKGGE